MLTKKEVWSGDGIKAVNHFCFDSVVTRRLGEGGRRMCITRPFLSALSEVTMPELFDPPTTHTHLTSLRTHSTTSASQETSVHTHVSE